MAGLPSVAGDTRWLTTSELVAALSEAGVEVSERQLKDWRQVGALPPSRVRSLGRGRGTVTIHLWIAVQMGIESARLLNQSLPLSEVVLILFARRFPIAERKLLAAYEAWFREADKPASPDAYLLALRRDSRSRGITDPLLKRKGARRGTRKQLSHTVADIEDHHPAGLGMLVRQIILGGAALPEPSSQTLRSLSTMLDLSPDGSRELIRGASVSTLTYARDAFCFLSFLLASNPQLSTLGLDTIYSAVWRQAAEVRDLAIATAGLVFTIQLAALHAGAFADPEIGQAIKEYRQLADRLFALNPSYCRALQPGGSEFLASLTESERKPINELIAAPALSDAP